MCENKNKKTRTATSDDLRGKGLRSPKAPRPHAGAPEFVSDLVLKNCLACVASPTADHHLRTRTQSKLPLPTNPPRGRRSSFIKGFRGANAALSLKPIAHGSGAASSGCSLETLSSTRTPTKRLPIPTNTSPYLPSVFKLPMEFH